MTITASTEQLENGSRNTTPAGDNLLRDFALAEAVAYEQLVSAAGGRVEHNEELGLVLTDAGSPCPFGNIAHLSGPVSADEAEALVDAMKAFYGAAAGGPYLVFSPFPTPDLTRFGLQLGGHPPMMIRPAASALADTSGLRIEVVRTGAQLDDFERTKVEAYPTAELSPFGSQPRLFAEPLLDSDWTLYVGYEGERAVATSAAFVTDRVATVEMISTRPECRGRGYGLAITAAAASTRTDRPSALVSSDLGNGVYRRLGYLPILRYTLWMGSRTSVMM
jgi:ribosomal protein S18 acetylase RimI-like enzyme